MNGKRKTLVGRLALPLGLSLSLHALLPAFFWLAPRSRHAAAATASADVVGPLSVEVDFGDGRRPTRPAPPKVEEIPDDFPVGLEPKDDGASVSVIDGSPLPADSGTSGQSVSGGGPSVNGGSPKAEPNLPPGAAARRVVYVIDRSMSMGTSDALPRARSEVAASLRALSPQARFQVIAYNNYAFRLSPPGADWLAPDEATLAYVGLRLHDLEAGGPTDHAAALRQALVARPDVLFWVTDAGDLTDAAINALTRLNAEAGARIHVVELAAGRADPNGALARLAAANGGTHRRLAPGAGR